MPSDLLRISAATVLLVCFASGTLAADARMYRTVPAPSWPDSRLHAQQRAWLARQPGATVVGRRTLNDLNATTPRDVLPYVPGAIVR
jgi:hypothetical protein